MECINQTDVHERSRQVQLIGTIYRSAAKVAIWFGSADPEDGFLIDKMRKWNRKIDDKQRIGRSLSI